MYEIVEIILCLVVTLLGVYMFAAPKSATKASNRNDEAAVAKTKKGGLLIMVLGAICTVGMIYLNFL